MKEDISGSSSEDDARRSAIARILRRRHRRVKPSANPKTDIKSWGEYSSIRLTPNGANGSGQSWIGITFGILAVGLPFLIFALLGIFGRRDGPEWFYMPSIVKWTFILVLSIAFLAAVLLTAAIITTSLFRIIKSNLPK